VTDRRARIRQSNFSSGRLSHFCCETCAKPRLAHVVARGIARITMRDSYAR